MIKHFTWMTTQQPAAKKTQARKAEELVALLQRNKSYGAPLLTQFIENAISTPAAHAWVIHVITNSKVGFDPTLLSAITGVPVDELGIALASIGWVITMPPQDRCPRQGYVYISNDILKTPTISVEKRLPAAPISRENLYSRTREDSSSFPLTASLKGSSFKSSLLTAEKVVSQGDPKNPTELSRSFQSSPKPDISQPNVEVKNTDGERGDPPEDVK
jgi:hypothetical protein